MQISIVARKPGIDCFIELWEASALLTRDGAPRTVHVELTRLPDTLSRSPLLQQPQSVLTVATAFVQYWIGRRYPASA
jgi:hypothetical protein